jgi:Putative zinc dependent peptidase (DUF5700)
MKTIALSLILVFTTQHCISVAQAPNEQEIDFSGVEAFWGIAERITNGTVTESDWDHLFSTGYYAFYANWGQRDHIRNTLTAALSPGKEPERDSLMNVDDFQAYILMQVVSTYADRVRLRALQENLVESSLRKKIIERAEEFLPSDLDLEANEPFICFGVFQPDANASRTSIAVDLKLYSELADPIGLIAHEYHHFMTMNYRRKFKEPENDSTSALMNALSQLQLEGIADMIDKDGFLNSDGRGFPSVLIERFRKALADPLPALREMDSLLIAIAKDPTSTVRNAEAIVELLPLGGHPHGFYMAKTIIEALGKEALLSTVADPFDFIRKYNSAYVKLNGAALFSEEAMSYLSLLESTHSL